MIKPSINLVRYVVGRHPGFTLVALPCILLAVLASLAWFPGTSPVESGTGTRPVGIAPIPQNRPAPNFDLPNISGSGAVRLANLRGDVVVVNFWASWCTVCQRDAPELRELYHHYQHAAVEFVGIDIDHGGMRSKARAFARRNGLSYPIVADTGDVLGQFGGIGVPVTYVIGRRGRIRFQLTGAIDPAALRRCVEQLRAG